MKTKFHHNLKFDTTQRKIEKFIRTITILLRLYTNIVFNLETCIFYKLILTINIVCGFVQSIHELYDLSIC